jgi:FdhD protein
MLLPSAIQRVQSSAHAPAGSVRRSRVVPEETPVALVYNGSTHAVMMATPADLTDYGIGFSLSEGIVTRADEITEISTIAHDLGIEIRMWLHDECARRLQGRRRHVAGPTGCGLCGIESLVAALRAPARVTGTLQLDPHWIADAVASLSAAQQLNGLTRAMHAAALYVPERGLQCLREDVGRHNALDKLAGAVARAGCDTARGAVVITSRVSVEMVQKAAAIGAPVLIAVSAPTALAIRAAEQAGLTLVAVARGMEHEVFTAPDAAQFRSSGSTGSGWHSMPSSSSSFASSGVATP